MRPSLAGIFLGVVFCSQAVDAEDLDVVISEIHYHPATLANDEFVELYNRSDESVDVSGWSIEDAVELTLSQGTVMGPRGIIVLARDKVHIETLFGLPDDLVYGDYGGKLSNSGERITLRDENLALVDRVAYRDNDPWPGTPDGEGRSLERTNFVADGEQQWVWRASIPMGGTPGAGTELRVFDSLIERGGEGIHVDTAFAHIERVHIRDLIGKSDCIDLDNDSSPRSIVRDCLLENSPDDGIDLGKSSALLEGNTIHGMDGKGLSLEGISSPHAARNVIYDCNDGIVCKDSITATIERCTVFGNHLGINFYEKNRDRGGGHAVADSMIVWGNGRDILLDSLSTLDITHSDVDGGYPGAGNRSFDPLFVSSADADFRLQPTSQAIGAGKGGVDMGALSVEGPEVPRFVRGDANRDNRVDVADAVRILLVLFAGSSPPQCPDALDADDSGGQNIVDAMYVLAFLFQGGGAPPAPYPSRGVDPTDTDPFQCADVP